MPVQERKAKRRSKLVRVISGVVVFCLLPSSIAFQDLGALLAGQPAVAAAKRTEQTFLIEKESK